jgi:hypothetical protein
MKSYEHIYEKLSINYINYTQEYILDKYNLDKSIVQEFFAKIYKILAEQIKFDDSIVLINNIVSNNSYFNEEQFSGIEYKQLIILFFKKMKSTKEKIFKNKSIKLKKDQKIYLSNLIENMYIYIASIISKKELQFNFITPCKSQKSKAIIDKAMILIFYASISVLAKLIVNNFLKIKNDKLIEKKKENEYIQTLTNKDKALEFEKKKTSSLLSIFSKPEFLANMFTSSTGGTDRFTKVIEKLNKELDEKNSFVTKLTKEVNTLTSLVDMYSISNAPSGLGDFGTVQINENMFI